MDIRIPDNEDSLNTFVINLNVALDKLDLEVVPFVDGLTGNQVYILVRSRGLRLSLVAGPDIFPTQANRKGDEIASCIGLFTLRVGLLQSPRASRLPSSA